jgi:DNA modification methylase
MFSFAGDTVLDPFSGTFTTSAAAARSGRNSIGVELDPVYYRDGVCRVRRGLGAPEAPNETRGMADEDRNDAA